MCRGCQSYGIQLGCKEWNKTSLFKRGRESGRKWLKLFLRRHPNLSFRKPQRVSAARIHAFTQENVDQLYSILEPEMVNIKISPNLIFNVDETGITIVQHKSSKVVGLKGKRQVASLSSAERGALVTVVTCMSASGQFVPPFAGLPQEEYEIRVAGWRTSWHD
jgi:hypothetical protein